MKKKWPDMKGSLKEAVYQSARLPILGKLYSSAHRVSGALYNASRERNPLTEVIPIEAVLEQFSLSGLQVLNGPFKGMRYPRASSCGSALLPKLIGSYEQELHPALAAFGCREYSTIVDIGCAEGYYAVGMALREQNSRVYAFDIDATARELCKEMAQLNGVSDRVLVLGICNIDIMKSLELGSRSLIICDCEGYEKELFDSEVAQSLLHHDFIIETHDFIDIEISASIKGSFADTHDVTSVFSLDDIQKAHTYDYREAEHLSLSDRLKIFGEGRPAIMEWIIAKSRQC
jgi:SAM-dependent methyltransferase